jgi:hypothetical protein
VKHIKKIDKFENQAKQNVQRVWKEGHQTLQNCMSEVFTLQSQIKSNYLFSLGNSPILRQ